MANIKILRSLHKCEVCGEYKGRLKKSDKYLTVYCLCDGILCCKCKRNKIHRPISNYYDEANNKIWHSPWFSYMKFCDECKNKKEIASSEIE
jgi:hypothetical protein